jgi:hypothetical protein
VIRGKRVVLRRVEPADYPDIQRWQNDAEVFYWMDYVQPFTLDDIRRSEERSIVEGHPFVIEVEGRGIGRIGLNNFRPRDGLASLYLFIGEPSTWGSGHGLDAVMTILSYAFDTLDLRMVELWSLATNERALRSYKSAGFVEDARMRQRSLKESGYVDHIVMSIDREAFDLSRESYGI